MVKLKHTSLVLISAECVWQLMSDVSRMIFLSQSTTGSDMTVLEVMAWAQD